MSRTFLWHDYETFGVDPRLDRPAQFAAVRTDEQLNEMGDPIVLYCRPTPDYLPDPQSCLITGITPQECIDKGIPEPDFAHVIEQALAHPGTIGVGYNTIRFDDEITRFLFWRNFIDPYGREWQNQCGRWDLLDVVRTVYAFRPDTLTWPTQDNGTISFRLEHLTRANNLQHEAAHDALSDVRATIALAKLIQTRQPKLFSFCFALHKKDRVAEELNLHLPPHERPPVLHISGMFPTEQGCLSIVWPLATHPTNKNEIIVWDCRTDPTEFFSLDATAIRTRMFTKASELPEGTARLPIKTIHLNRSPIVVRNLNTLTAERAEQLNIPLTQCLHHAHLAANYIRRAPNMDELWSQVFTRPIEPAPDVEADLYSGFISARDRRLLNQLRTTAPEKLAHARFHFEDSRLNELLFRYRARHFPHTLLPEEAQHWDALRTHKLLHGPSRTFDQVLQNIQAHIEHAPPRNQTILGALHEYITQLLPQKQNAS